MVRYDSGVSDDRSWQSIAIGASTLNGNMWQLLTDDPLGRDRVLLQNVHDGLAAHGCLGLVPAVVVGDERQRSVAHLRFSRQFSLRDIGHTDDFHAPLTVDARLCLGRKLWPLNAQ